MTKRTQVFIVAAVLLTILLLLPAVAEKASARQANPTATATPPHKPTLTATATTPATITIAPGDAPTPLPTIAFGPLVPTDQATPAPTVTPTVEAPANSLTEAPPAAEGINPLTGLPVNDPAILARRPLLVKISNSPYYVRPQHAVGRADHVWEHVMEGGVTRLTAVYLTEDMPQIGSVRSARPIDTYLMPIYQGMLVYSGASIGTTQLLQAQPWYGDRTFSPDENDQYPLFYRYEREGADIDFWHTMYASAPAIREEAKNLGVDTAIDLRGLAFSETPPPGGTPAGNITIGYPGTNMFWLYSPTADKYYRWQEGEPHHDAVGNVQVIYANVVMIYANHVETDIVEDEMGVGHHAMDIQLVGEGPAVVFRSGQRYDGRWVRPADEGMIRLVDAAGEDIPLTPGRTWFHAVPLDHSALVVGN